MKELLFVITFLASSAAFAQVNYYESRARQNAEYNSLSNSTQRAYSASSKIITTADEMLAELISIKR